MMIAPKGNLMFFWEYRRGEQVFVKTKDKQHRVSYESGVVIASFKNTLQVHLTTMCKDVFVHVRSPHIQTGVIVNSAVAELLMISRVI